MSWHYIVNPRFADRPWIGIRKIKISYAEFSLYYKKFKPHRPRWAEKRFHKRVRLYIQRPDEEVYKIAKKILEEPAWWTCCIKYDNFDRGMIDCSATGQGTELEIKQKLKDYMLANGFPERWWVGFCLEMNERTFCIECEEAVDEKKTEEEKCVGNPFKHS